MCRLSSACRALSLCVAADGVVLIATTSPEPAERADVSRPPVLRGITQMPIPAAASPISLPGPVSSGIGPIMARKAADQPTPLTCGSGD